MRRSDRWALLFVGTAMLLVLVLPVLAERRASELRTRLEDLAEPTRDAASMVQYQLAREMSNLRAYLLTNDSTFLERYEQIALQQRRTLAELTVLAERLDPEAAVAALLLSDKVERWQRSLTPGEGDGAEATREITVLLDQRLYEQASAAAAEFDQRLGALTRDLRQRIRSAERVALILTLTLAALAVAAAGVLVWFGRRFRLLAAEAAHRHHQTRAALEETRRAFDARDRLVRGVTHDVKNPLGAADGYAEILQMGLRGPLTSEQSVTVASIRRSLQSALAIIDDLLELARAERSRLPLSFRNVSLNEVVTRAAEAHRGALEAAGQVLDLSLPPAVLEARTDPLRLEQILGNLLSNAAKYGGRGPVSVVLEWEAGPAGSALEWGRITVRDSGPGIPADQLERVFTEFHRLHQGPQSGHGLGLAIARHLARQLGGELIVRSDEGRGAAFILTVPLTPRAAAEGEWTGGADT